MSNPSFPAETAAVVEAIADLVAAIRRDDSDVARLLDCVDVRVSLCTKERALLVSVLHPGTGRAVPFVAINADAHDPSTFGQTGLPVAVSGLHDAVEPRRAN